MESIGIDGDGFVGHKQVFLKKKGYHLCSNTLLFELESNDSPVSMSNGSFWTSVRTINKLMNKIN